ncbi:MAG TPA: hypothetical protein DER58_08385 [Firmicutes bacterium]|nr:hypothetical protein [Bacillota bacterium]HCF92472.1 hypothetical protein [Bacillota bacterium]
MGGSEMAIKNLKVFKVDSFTDQLFGGNPAGVVPDATGLSERQMQLIAREVNAAETAFVTPSQEAGVDYHVRFFTPECEVPLCGHATVAAYHVLSCEGYLPTGCRRITQQTGAGILPVELRPIVAEIANGDPMCATLPTHTANRTEVWMTQPLPEFRPFHDDPAPVLQALGLDGSCLDPEKPIEFVSTGLWDLMLPLKNLDCIRKINPDHQALAALNRAQGVVSTHVWTFETTNTNADLDHATGHTAHVRNLGAAVGVPEDPVTGTANGAFGSYLIKNRLLPVNEGCNRFTIEQGYEIDRPGLVHTEIDCFSGDITRVQVGGSAVTIFRGELRLTPA